MYKNIFILLSVCITLLHPNIFIITDKHGHIEKRTILTHKRNAFLEQKATEYSLQAIYNELHKEENLAKLAQEARDRAVRIAKEKAAARQRGSSYHISKLDKQKLIEDAKYFKGGKYVWGGTTPQGFDCSGYVQYLYKKHHINLPRTAYAQSKRGISIERHKVQKGDLLFFLTDKKRNIPVTHVGIYLGNGKFIHAASKRKGIIISPLFTGYYASKFVSAKRVIQKTSNNS